MSNLQMELSYLHCLKMYCPGCIVSIREQLIKCVKLAGIWR